MKLALAKEMQQLDRAAIEQYGIPGIVLMENAGQGTVALMLRELGPATGKNALIFAGPGNNGGDGLVIARRLHQLGGFPFLIYLTDPDKLKGDAGINHEIATRLGLPFRVMHKTEELEGIALAGLELPGSHTWAIIDAVFGTGLQRPLTGHFLAAVNCMNRLRGTGIPVVSVDLPSGLHADTGSILGGAVQADLTVTYGLAKPGHFVHGGSQCGTVHVVDINIPAVAVDNAGLKGEVLDASVLEVIPARSAASHKGTYGHLLALAGSSGKTGAALLCGLGALRIGTGLVTLAAPSGLGTVFESNLPEAMTLLLPKSSACPSVDDYLFILDNFIGKTALALGPGIGTSEQTGELVARLYCEAKQPMAVDADALNILALKPECLTDPPAPRILTPHPGEMARLTGLTSKEIQADRLGAALGLTASLNKHANNVTVILKGAGTIISDPAGTWAVNPTGNPGMAAGGMGDVLTGIIGGLLAQGVSPARAARSGVFIHGLAADGLARKQRFGYLASEVADAVPVIITKLRHNNK